MEPQPAYDLDFLLQALSSAHERVASWGAYQLVLKGGLDSEIKFFLESPFSAIQEAGMAYMAETGNETFLSEAIGIFRESEGQLKYSAAFCLACFPNDFSKNLLFKWFDQVTQSEHSTRLELEAATYSLLQVDPQAGFDKVFARLRDSGKNIIQASILWQHLLPCIKTQPELDGCMEQYFFLRETYSDTDLTYHLVEQFVGNHHQIVAGGFDLDRMPIDIQDLALDRLGGEAVVVKQDGIAELKDPFGIDHHPGKKVAQDVLQLLSKKVIMMIVG